MVAGLVQVRLDQTSDSVVAGMLHGSCARPAKPLFQHPNRFCV